MKSLNKRFRYLTRKDRLGRPVEYGWLDGEDYEILLSHPLINEEVANSLVRNVTGQDVLPVRLLPRIIVDDKEYVVPMMIEEPSVMAAASYGAELVNQSDGFKTISGGRLMTGQIVFDDTEGTGTLANLIYQIKPQIHRIADEAYPSIKARDGGYQRIEIDTFPNHQLLSLKVFVDTKDAMGTNTLNTMLEAIATHPEVKFSNRSVSVSILSSYTTASVVKVQGEIDIENLHRGERNGEEVAQRMERASVLVQVDIHRTTTHSKGVMDGIHAVVLATGNDTRGVEAGAHACASKDGHYGGIATWEYNRSRNKLVGTIKVPMTSATVGGSTKVLPIAKASLNLLNIKDTQGLGQIVAAVGLAQSFSVYRALVSEGM